MLRAVIVDDEQLAIDLLKILLEDTGKVKCVGEYCMPPEDAMNIVELQPDVVFLDVEMPGMNGIELAGAILERSADIDIVFVTAFRNYAVEAFELNAIDYLLKPALPETVDRSVSRLLKHRQQRRPSSRLNTETYINGFGKFEVRNSLNGNPIKWRTAKVEELFAYLLYHRGTIIRKGEIIDSLWPECEPKTADNHLHMSVYNLKRALKKNNINISVKFSGGGYVMELDPAIDYDVAGFETFTAKRRALAKDNIGEFEKMVAVYQGDYLEGKDYLWCSPERTRLQKYFSELVKQVARYYIDAANCSKAEQILLRSIGYLPYDEDAYELLLNICSLQGDRVAMIKYYETIQDVLQSELGIEPRPSLKRLYESLINDF